jgi:4-hydroxybenzoyl-CoA thioesterase
MRPPVAEVRTAHKRSSAGRVYRSEILIRFAHCDPAGIVFFPRYLVMFNDLVEDWCRDELGFGFAEIHAGRGWGLPTVHLDVDFLTPSRIGDRLTAHLTVRAIGTSSLTLAIVLRGPDDRDRVRAELVVVLVDPGSMRATPIPDDVRQRIAPFHAAD